MQTPASHVLAAIAYRLVAQKVIHGSESVIIYWLTLACMVFTSAFLWALIWSIKDNLRPRALQTNYWLPHAAVATLQMLTLFYLGPLISFAIYYPGASMLAEVCGPGGESVHDPCGSERLRLWIRALIFEPEGWRQLLEKQAWFELSLLLIVAGVSLFFELVVTPWVHRSGGMADLRRWWKTKDHNVFDHPIEKEDQC